MRLLLLLLLVLLLLLRGYCCCCCRCSRNRLALLPARLMWCGSARRAARLIVLVSSRLGSSHGSMLGTLIAARLVGLYTKRLDASRRCDAARRVARLVATGAARRTDLLGSRLCSTCTARPG
jgi:hypothetical protein